MLNNVELEKWGEYLAYIALIIVFFFKTFKSFYNSIKEFFGKDKAPTPSQNTINVNLDKPELLYQNEYQRILYLLLQQAKILRALHDIKIDTLKEQMDFFAKQMRSIKIRYTALVCDMLNDAGIDDIHFGTYFTNSENFIEVCGHHIESLYRQMCKENHFSDQSSQEFRELIQRNIYVIDGVLDELLRKRYPQRQIIKSFDKFNLLRAELKDHLQSCFEQARDVAIEKETTVFEAKKQFEEQITNLTGLKYSLDL
jgi:hypothetical protein